MVDSKMLFSCFFSERQRCTSLGKRTPYKIGNEVTKKRTRTLSKSWRVN